MEFTNEFKAQLIRSLPLRLSFQMSKKGKKHVMVIMNQELGLYPSDSGLFEEDEPTLEVLKL